MNKAFTLAEIIITIGIIGVVAAITMPSLITNIQNKGYVERMKKAYSLIIFTGFLPGRVRSNYFTTAVHPEYPLAK